MVEDRRRAAEAGANEHISKPILCGTLYDAMTRWLDRAAPPCGYSNAPSMPDPASLAALPDLMEGFHLEEGLAMVNNNPDDYRELLLVFKEQLERNLGDTLDCLERGDRAAAEHKSHTLKGAAGAVGAVRLAAAATTVNRALKTEAAVTDAAVEELAEAMAEVRRGLAALENDS
jgi:HPt (histidine-containing phosphotransfer) domain-containing protein